MPLSSDIENIIYNGVHSSFERHFRTADGMPSGIRLKLFGSLRMNFLTSSGDKLMFDNWTSVRMFSVGKVQSSLVNTNENCLFNTLALSALPTANSPQIISRGYPVFAYTPMVDVLQYRSLPTINKWLNSQFCATRHLHIPLGRYLQFWIGVYIWCAV